MAGRSGAFRAGNKLRGGVTVPKRKIQYQGQDVWGEDVEFETDREAWNTYILQDGTTLKTKAVVSEVVRLEEYTADGDPVYLIKSTNIVTAIVPEQLKRKG